LQANSIHDKVDLQGLTVCREVNTQHCIHDGPTNRSQTQLEKTLEARGKDSDLTSAIHLIGPAAWTEREPGQRIPTLGLHDHCFDHLIPERRSLLIKEFKVHGQATPDRDRALCI